MALSTSGISFSGLASGIDTSSLIQKLVQLESQPIQQLQNQKQDFQAKLSTVGTLKGLVKELQTKAQTLSKQETFLSFLTSTSLDGHVAASASGSATAGTHTVVVNKLATIDRWTFDAVADKSVDLASANGQHITFSVGATNYDVPVDAATSNLEDIAAKINSVAGEKVAASVVNIGTAASPSYQLVMTAKDSGHDNRIANITNDIAGLHIDTTGPNASGQAQSANNITVGNDAEAVIDGLTVVRDTNDFNDVVAGLSLTAQTADPSTTISVSVNADTGAIKAKIKDLVTSYNKLVDFVNTQNSYSKDNGPGGNLFGDPLLGQVMSQVRGALLNVPLGTVQSDTAGYSTLQLVGVKIQSDGKLKVDDTVLDDKIADNLDKLADLFVDSDGFDNGGAAQNTSGYYTDTTADSGLAATLDRAIDRMFDSFTGPNNAVYKGLFDTRTKTYNDTINKLLKQIDDKQTQVDKFQNDLTLKFANLESVMGSLQSQGAALQAGLAGITNLN